MIWLASYPRSGNTFFRALVYEVYGAHTHEFYDRHGDPASSEALRTIFGAATTRPSLEEMKSAEACYLVKTHEMPDDDCPAIYLVRDGRDALVSHAHFVLQHDERVPPDAHRARYDDTLKMLIETDASFGGWSGNVRAWTTRSTGTTIVRFEELIERPLACLRRTMADVGYPLPERPSPRIPTFGELQQKVPPVFRKGRVGSWREEMCKELQELFWIGHGDVMHAMGYSRDSLPPS